MNGQSHWLPVILVLGVLCGIVAMAWLALRQWQRYRYRRLQLECPGSHELVDVVLRQELAHEDRVDVEHCTSSTLADPDRVTCRRACLEDIKV